MGQRIGIRTRIGVKQEKLQDLMIGKVFKSFFVHEAQAKLFTMSGMKLIIF